MLMPKFCLLSRWSPVAVIFLALITFNLAQAQAAQARGSATPDAHKSIWKRMPTPNPGGDALALAIAGDSEKDVWVVGDFIALKFDGQTWNSVAPVFPGGEGALDGVTVISPTDVWAVGSVLLNGTHLISVIEHYDGTRWKLVDNPQFASGSKLYKVQAFSANDIYAVGEFHSDSQKGKPLVEHYDGTKWSVVQVPALKNVKNAVLSAVAGLSHNDFWIAGTTAKFQGGSGDPLVFHFDGQQFNQVQFPGTGVSIGGIAEIAANDAWIVGGSNGSPLAAHWDGTAFTIVPAPGKGTGSGFTGVSAISSDNIWASGSVTDVNKGFLYLIEHWDGKSWTISKIHPTPGGFDAMFGAKAFPSGSVFMIGVALDCQDNFCSGFAPAVFHTNQGK